MLATPFLTQLDSRAAIKGSRDPLGVQPIWSRFGREVVGNLTTVSSSVHDFTITVLGYHFVERVADRGARDGGLATFVKWEQIAGYARARTNGERGFRGTERVWKRLAEEERVPIGTSASAQILADQKIYGLWGLYTRAAKASGLLEGNPTRLTPVARELVEKHFLPRLLRAGLRETHVVEKLTAPNASIDLREKSKDSVLLHAVGKLLGSLHAPEVHVYREHLLFGGPGDLDPNRPRGKQRVFAELLEETADDSEWKLDSGSLAMLASRARSCGEVGVELGHKLDRIRTCEQVLAPVSAFFEFVLASDDRAPREVADDVRDTWGTAPRAIIDVAATEGILDGLRAAGPDPDAGMRWVALARALHEGEYEEVLRLALEQNASVMRARSAAAPWATVRSGKLHVSFRDDQLSKLPAGADLPSYWRHAYFIESLRDVARALRAPR